MFRLGETVGPCMTGMLLLVLCVMALAVLVFSFLLFKTVYLNKTEGIHITPVPQGTCQVEDLIEVVNAYPFRLYQGGFRVPYFSYCPESLLPEWKERIVKAWSDKLWNTDFTNTADTLTIAMPEIILRRGDGTDNSVVSDTVSLQVITHYRGQSDSNDLLLLTCVIRTYEKWSRGLGNKQTEPFQLLLVRPTKESHE